MTVLVILGYRLNDDGSMAYIMRERLERALVFIRDYHPDKIIVSGGIANKKAGISEASKMYEYLVNHQIDRNQVIIEDRSHTTVENAKYSSIIIKEINANIIYVCSSENHIKRKFLNPIKLFQKQLGDCVIKSIY